MPNFEKLEAKLRARLEGTKLGDEIDHLSGQYFGGGLLKAVLIALAHASSIVLASYILYWILDSRLLIAECSHACVWSIRGQCCASSFGTLALLFAFTAFAFVGSLLSTRCTTQRRFQRSALVSAFVIMTSLLVLCRANGTLGFLALFHFVLFLALFFGYRLGLKNK